jgi:ABC-type nickel/cobalt efflux system permease component RcnA/ABC-type uncharacterized transport system substrate-binding protein
VRVFKTFAIGTAASLMMAGGSIAHPHIFIDATANIVFDDAGAIARIDHSWTFDPYFSIWTVQGLDTDGDGTTSSEELQGLADENMIGLAEYGFYTYAGIGERELTFSAAGDPAMSYVDEQVTLDFGVVPTETTPVSRLELAVNDPEYYVAIEFADVGAVTLENAPPSCAIELVEPQPMAPEVEEQLYSLGPEVLELPPELAAAMRGTQGLIVIDCGPVVADTAAEAATQMAQARPTPFGGPPPEPGLTLPRTGFFGWLADQQRAFYAAMTNSLGQVRSDFNAFWLLGGLSFLYGIFHAAGPGHGKVVISSYMLANERQLRQGVALSFVSSMLQAVVAIAFVLVLAGVLGVTSMAMGDAAHWIGVLSYALVAALGAWLVARKLVPGLVHDHGHGAHDHHHDHDHGHHHHDHADHHDDHRHIVTPADLRGSWREKLGVVLAVGLRPCSGALVVLVFALSQGVLFAGIVATVLMALGTFITVALLATLAVGAKAYARRLSGADSATAAKVVWWLELAGALAVLLFGIALLIASV